MIKKISPCSKNLKVFYIPTKYLITPWVILLFLFAFLHSTTILSAPISPQEIWSKVTKTWKNIDSFTCKLSYAFKDTVIYKYTNRKEATGWRLYVLDYRFKKPNKIYMEFIKAKNLGTDIAATLASKPGTRIVYGYFPDKDIYTRLPLTRDAAMNTQIKDKIYHIPADFYVNERVDIGFADTVGTMIEKRQNYFQNSSVVVEKKNSYISKTNFDVKNKMVKYDDVIVNIPVYEMTFNFKNTVKTKGITKEIVFIDPESYFLKQIEIYEKEKLLGIIVISDLKLDANLKDSLWEDFFKTGEIIQNQATFQKMGTQ